MLTRKFQKFLKNVRRSAVGKCWENKFSPIFDQPQGQNLKKADFPPGGFGQFSNHLWRQTTAPAGLGKKSSKVIDVAAIGEPFKNRLNLHGVGPYLTFFRLGRDPSFTGPR